MAQSKNGYVPPAVQRAMDQHMQRMPANLQKYQSGNSYIPSQAAKSMANYMQKSMPAHMKEYIKPYMQQKVTAGLNSLDPGTARTLQPRAPIPNLVRRDHSGFGEQFTVNASSKDQSRSHKNLSFAPQYSGHSATTPAPPAPPPVNPHSGGQNPYSFLFEDPKKLKKSLFPSGNSTKQRIIFATGGVVFLLLIAFIVFSIFTSSGKANKQDLTDVVTQQTELVRIANIGASKSSDPQTKNLAYTASLSLESSNTKLLGIYRKIGLKLGTKQLTSTKNTATDALLNSASQANNFDSVFNQELTKELASYKAAVKKAYDSTETASIKAALSDAYKNATILTEVPTN